MKMHFLGKIKTHNDCSTNKPKTVEVDPKLFDNQYSTILSMLRNEHLARLVTDAMHILPDKGRAFKLDFIIKSSSYRIILFAHTRNHAPAQQCSGEKACNTKRKYIAIITGIMWAVYLLLRSLNERCLFQLNPCLLITRALAALLEIIVIMNTLRCARISFVQWH